ncbi:hypothetical protein BN6_55400 [Saccharothrix espanaensis DSM 44229]|uniref:Uncharacterized protein n=1 Tax=Saccharothrix espanaensis (strain ATCC 51144 / DSM 44229 / JCM 9112 / NBRC 15066 / NRRL 15764) TaxID=1179773 RepID=K0K7C8_SACES|nr:hypothetical protein BN6_55400 [Saccharothrix espanaensis DSM 44229]
MLLGAPPLLPAGCHRRLDERNHLSVAHALAGRPRGRVDTASACSTARTDISRALTTIARIAAETPAEFVAVLHGTALSRESWTRAADLRCGARVSGALRKPDVPRAMLRASGVQRGAGVGNSALT